MLAQINQWLALFSLLITVANSLWIWLSRPARDTTKKIEEANQRITTLEADKNARAERFREEFKAHDRRIQRVEDDLRHLPTKDDLNEVGHGLTAVKTELDTVARVVTRIDEFLRAK